MTWGSGRGRLPWENLMPYARNVNPEWGYVAPAPGVMRTALLIVVAAIIGATASAATVFSLLDRPVAEESVAARTLVAPDPKRPVTASTSVAAQQPPEPQQVKSPAEAQNSAEQKLHPRRRPVHSRASLLRPRRRRVRPVLCARRGCRGEGLALCSDLKQHSSSRARPRAGPEAANQETAHDVANRAAYRCSAQRCPKVL